MSLIQEALRRQREEHGDGAEPQQASQPTQEPAAHSLRPTGTKPADSMPAEKKTTAAPPAQSAKKKRLLPVLALAAILILATGAATIYLADYVISAFKGKKPVAAAVKGKTPAQPAAKAGAEPPAAPAGSGAVPQEQPAPEEAAEAPKTPAAAGADAGAQEKIEPQTQPAPAQQAAAKPPAPPKPQAPAQPPAKPPVAATAARPAAKPPAPQPAAETPKKKISWPSLKLQGILRGPTLEQSAALINNKTIEIGSQINGATLTEIKPDGVVLQIEHETRTLRVGESM